MTALLPAPFGARTARIAARLFVVLVVGAVVVTLAARPAHAHADLVSASPAPNSVATAAVDKIVLRFNESVVLFGSGVTVTDNRQTYTTIPSIAGTVVTATLATPLGGGTYEVAVSFTSPDGHQSTSTYPFSIAATVVTATTSPSSSTTTGASSTTAGASLTTAGAPTTMVPTTTTPPVTATTTTSRPANTKNSQALNVALYGAIGIGMVAIAFAIRGIVVLIRRRRN